MEDIYLAIYSNKIYKSKELDNLLKIFNINHNLTDDYFLSYLEINLDYLDLRYSEPDGLEGFLNNPNILFINKFRYYIPFDDKILELNKVTTKNMDYWLSNFIETNKNKKLDYTTKTTYAHQISKRVDNLYLDSYNLNTLSKNLNFKKQQLIFDKEITNLQMGEIIGEVITIYKNDVNILKINLINNKFITEDNQY